MFHINTSIVHLVKGACFIRFWHTYISQYFAVISLKQTHKWHSPNSSVMRSHAVFLWSRFLSLTYGRPLRVQYRVILHRDISRVWNYLQSIDEADRTVDQDREFLSANCQDGIFSGVLFTKAYGFEANTTLIKVVSEINGEDVSKYMGNFDNRDLFWSQELTEIMERISNWIHCLM